MVMGQCFQIILDWQVSNHSLIPNVNLHIAMICLMLSVYLCPKVITLRSFHCTSFYYKHWEKYCFYKINVLIQRPTARQRTSYTKKLDFSVHQILIFVSSLLSQHRLLFTVSSRKWWKQSVFISKKLFCDFFQIPFKEIRLRIKFEMINIQETLEELSCCHVSQQII